VKSVGGIAPRAAQIASGQADENARQSGTRAFSLNRFEDFGDEHEIYRLAFPPGLMQSSRLVLFCYFPGRYCALAVSVSQITMSVTRAPAGNALTWPVTSS